MVDYKGFTSKRLCCECQKEKAASNQQICEELKQYRVLEERLEKMFGGNLSLEKCVDELEAVLTEPNSPHPMSARILTYAESAKWDEYCRLEEQGLLLKVPCKLGDTVWELCKCDDNVYRIFPMVVKQVVPDGAVRWIKDKEPTVWNIYAISDYTDMYKSFYDFGKTVFLTKSEAEKRLRELEEMYAYR